jgi:hypothetical protein
MVLYSYFAYGLAINSTFEIPELNPVSRNLPADITIDYGITVSSLNNIIGSGITYQYNHNEFLLVIDGICSYHVTEGRRITVQLYDEADLDTVRLFLLETAFAVLLQQRGLITLNASVIRTPRGAVIFVGSNNSGKSVLAAMLYCRHYELLSDEIGAVTQDKSGQLVILPGYPMLKLWQDALLALHLSPERRLRPQLQKYGLRIANHFYTTPLPIHMIYVLKKDSFFHIDPIKGLSKLATLKNGICIPRIASRSQVLLLEMGQIPQYHLAYPRHWESLETLGDTMSKAWDR